MSFLLAPTVLETITPTDKARDSPVITPLHDDPYMAAPLAPDYTLASPDYTHDTPHLDEDSEPIKASDTRIASPSCSTSPLPPDHPLTQISPTSTPSRAFYYCSTTHMVMRTQPTLWPGISARVTEVMALSPSSFRKRYRSSYETSSSSASPTSSLTLPIQKRYRGTFEPILDTKTEGDESEAEGIGSKSEESEDEGPGSEGEEATPEGQSVLDQNVADEMPRLPTRPTWVNLEDGTVYIDIKFDAPPVHALVQTPASPKFSSGSLPVSPASLIIPSPVASLLTTPAATIAVEEDEFIEVRAQLELHESILHDHTHRLDALPPTLIEERGQKQATIMFGALWQLVLALEAWAGRTDAQRAALWQARYKDQREIQALRMQHATD
ncbi:hypothetical protein Tco_1227027 [Tanacetum coccineum]